MLIMAKTTTPTVRQKRTPKKVKVYKRKHHAKLLTDRLDLLSVARSILKVYSVDSKIISSKISETYTIR